MIWEAARPAAWQPTEVNFSQAEHRSMPARVMHLLPAFKMRFQLPPRRRHLSNAAGAAAVQRRRQQAVPGKGQNPQSTSHDGDQGAAATSGHAQCSNRQQGYVYLKFACRPVATASQLARQRAICAGGPPAAGHSPFQCRNSESTLL